MTTRQIDCAVFGAPGTEDWVAHRLDHRQAGVVWWPLLSDGVGVPLGHDIQDLLATLRLRAARFDVLVLLVSRAELVWSRQVLAALMNGPPLGRPIVAVVRSLGAPAIGDLLRLGLSDFIDERSDAAEQRARLLRAVVAYHASVAPTPGAGFAGPAAVSRAADGVAEPLVAYTAPPSAWSAESVCATVVHCPTLMRHGCPMSQSVERAVLSNEPYRQAKERVLDRFEYAYVRAMLGVHYGNITRAALGACKPRRAFWGLVRKHGIDASAYYHRPRAVLGRAGCGRTAKQARAQTG